MPLNKFCVIWVLWHLSDGGAALRVPPASLGWYYKLHQLEDNPQNSMTQICICFMQANTICQHKPKLSVGLAWFWPMQLVLILYSACLLNSRIITKHFCFQHSILHTFILPLAPTFRIVKYYFLRWLKINFINWYRCWKFTCLLIRQRWSFFGGKNWFLDGINHFHILIQGPKTKETWLSCFNVKSNCFILRWKLS